MDRVAIDPADTDNAPEIGRILTHRAIVDQAHRRGLRNVLIIEDADDLLQAVAAVGRDRLKAVHKGEWAVVLLGDRQPEADSDRCCATAYHRSVFDQLLDHIPAQPETAAQWLTGQNSLSDYLRAIGKSGEYFPSPAPKNGQD